MRPLNRKEISKAKLLEFILRKGREKSEKRVHISDLCSLFIDVWCLKNKLDWIRYELGCVLIPKNLKWMHFILTKAFLGRASKLCRSQFPILVQSRLFFRDFLSRELFLPRILKLIPFILIIRSLKQ